MATFLKNFLEALRTKECILFIGSGISRWSGLPDWQGLVHRMADFLDERGLLNHTERAELEEIIQGSDLLTAASICASRMRPADKHDFIDEVFIKPNPRPHEIHEIIVDLGPDSFITTNYDRLIDDAYQKVHRGLLLRSVNNDQPTEQARIMKHGESRFIFTPHGRADRVDTIILTREDYRKRTYDSGTISKSLEHLFISRPVVYLGFGLTDPDFLMIKDQIALTYGGGEREHFAILPDVSDMLARFWRETYGINIVSYATQEVELDGEHGEKRKQHRHDELLGLLRDIWSQLKPAREPIDASALRCHDGLSSGMLYDLTPQQSLASLFEAEVRQVRSALIRYCEDIRHTFLDRTKEVAVFASFRPDLSPAESKIEIERRKLPVIDLLDSSGNVIVIGPPGAGKTFAMETYAAVLAERTLARMRATEPTEDKPLRHCVPLILSMREYSGNIESMIAARLPGSIDAAAALQSNFLVVIFDAVNELAEVFVETRVFTSDISSFAAKYPSIRLLFTTRSGSYLPPLALPVYELQPVGYPDLHNYLLSKGIRGESLPAAMWTTLQTPLFLSLFLQARAGQPSQMSRAIDLLGAYFQIAQNRFDERAKDQIPILEMLGPIAFDLISRGSQTMGATEIEQILAKTPNEHLRRPGSNISEVLNPLISIGVLVADAEGKVGFFHQTALEYAAAMALVAHQKQRRFLLKEFIRLRRWDETMILLVCLLPPEQGGPLLKEMAQTDIVLACQAFESAAIKDEAVGLFLFDELAARLSDPLLPDFDKPFLARALPRLAPYGRKEILARLLDDSDTGGQVAILLAQMGAKEFVPRMITLLLADRMGPSPFARALQAIADEKVIGTLIDQARQHADNLTIGFNLGEVLKGFESEWLYGELSGLARSSRDSERELAARILDGIRSQRAQAILADMLADHSSSVRFWAVHGLSGIFAQHPYKSEAIVARMFELLADPSCGHMAAEYLNKVYDDSILIEAKRRLERPRDDFDLINLCGVLARECPDQVRELLFEKVQRCDRRYGQAIWMALARIPPAKVVQHILSLFRLPNEDLRLTLVEALRMIPPPGEQLPISEGDCTYLVQLWEQLPESGVRAILGEVLPSRFQALAKPLLLERLSNPTYGLRLEILGCVDRLPLVQGDLTPEVVDWLIGNFGLQWGGPCPPYAPAQIVGRAADESLLVEKLVPLLSSSNSAVRNSAYQAIRIAELQLGKRFLAK